MRHGRKNRLDATLFAVAVIIIVMLVANPELRVILLFADSIGLDLLAVILAMQLRHFAYALLPATNAIARSFCAIAFCMGNRAMRTFPKALPWRPFDRIFCPALVFMTYGIRCGVAR